MGCPGSGKSTSIRFKLAADEGTRRLVWDPGEDYGEFGRVTAKPAEVARAVLDAGASGSFKIVFRPSHDATLEGRQFAALCSLAYAAGNCLFVADELENVMLASWAPPEWRRLVRLGRKRGCRIVAASQVPAGIEKRFWDLATVIRSGKVQGDSAVVIARALMVSPHDVMALPLLDFIERGAAAPVIRWGRIEWRGGRPVQTLLREKSLLVPAPG